MFYLDDFLGRFGSLSIQNDLYDSVQLHPAHYHSILSFNDYEESKSEPYIELPRWYVCIPWEQDYTEGQSYHHR